VSFQNRGVSFAGRLTYEAFLIHSVVYYYITLYWPVTSSITIPTGDYVALMFLNITLVMLISLGYGLVRYYMDQGLVMLIKRIGLGNAGRWIMNRLL
jgi:peptidoglycan/LPS O-acetylase OafA/YrhL